MIKPKQTVVRVAHKWEKTTSNQEKGREKLKTGVGSRESRTDVHPGAGQECVRERLGKTLAG
jgi:hypothetical protein